MKTTIRNTATFSFLFFFFPLLFSQLPTKKEFKQAVRKADNSFYYVKDYVTAARLFGDLIKTYPDNCNFLAKMGICYMNIEGKNGDAMKLLDKATAHVVESEKEYSDYGDKAPLDVYLYRAIAYHRSDSLTKAIAFYNEAKKKLAGTRLFQEEFIDMQIGDCRYAIEMKKKPLTIISNLFAPWLSEYQGASNPVLSKNDSVFIFTLKDEGKTRIFCSYNTGKWNKPVDITMQLGGFDRFYSNSVTGDGKLLVVFMDDGGDGNLYYSTRKDTVWTKIKGFGKPINSIYWESHGFITPDGKTMYFSSNRAGGEGELDIWVSNKNDNGSWGDPVNCGKTINTPYNEDMPFFEPETGALIFSSMGHLSMGGYDVFRSVNRNGVWTQPVALPYAFNTSGDNTFFILNNNKPGFITSIYDEKTNSRNIYALVAEDPADKINTVNGTISLQDGLSVDPKEVRILVNDKKAGSQTRKIELLDSASFKFEVKPGDYVIYVSHTGYKTDTINLNVPLYSKGNYISVTASLVPEKVFEGAFLSIKNILFDFDSYKLNDDAVTSLNTLSSILKNYPDLHIEIAGYTDAKGSSEYNMKLADNRAQAVMDYLTASGISTTRFVKKAFGKSNFAAINTNHDGTDNPEGRKYNRRVTFGIVDSQSGVVIRQETYTPDHLRLPHSMKYSIVLLKTKEVLRPGYFDSVIKSDQLFVRTIKMDSVSLYVLGVFYTKAEAMKYLEFAREKGFDKAYILDQYELDNESRSTSSSDAKPDISQKGQMVYILQLKATKNPVNISETFKGVEGVKEVNVDGYYKYLYGEYSTLSKAKEALNVMKNSGFEDAFIKQVEVNGSN
jgi:outer membrane protein OmpA-like peptidoglycan-associated protein/tetratricopeptide (TPR) repeat protein